jgi:hydroxyacylglutathione hydrolase
MPRGWRVAKFEPLAGCPRERPFMARLEIEIVPVLRDNYSFVVRHRATNTCALIDPGAGAPIMETLDRLRWTPKYVLITHHHHDQHGGLLGLRQRFEFRVIAPEGDADKIPGVDVRVRDNHVFKLGGLEVRVLAVPGHTAGHVAYWMPEAETVFTGDSLLVLGCGRLHEGTAKEMWASLERLRKLPPQTKVYCAHEHTQTNLQFASSVDPDNGDLRARAEEIVKLRHLGLPTVPTTIGAELKMNPFFRADTEVIKANLGMTDKSARQVFSRLRKRRDEY